MTLEEQVLVLIAENKQLREKISNLENHILQQDNRISYLEEELRKARTRKNSSNSSLAPSTDISNPKRNQSLRESSGKKSGGQLGHKGTTLQMSDTPDEITELNPNYCSKCGCDLEQEEAHFESKRQEYDIPLIKFIVKEYRRNSKKCPSCGHNQESKFPEHITNHVQYGQNVESLVSYLSVYQYLPFRRLKECMRHFFKLNFSEGTINNMLNRMSKKSQPIYDTIRETISQSKQVGSDETSVKVNSKKHWIWAWQTPSLTFLTASKSRGSQTIDNIFPAGLPNSVLNSDRWAAQLKTVAAGHQLCIAHLLRDLKYLEQLERNNWTKRLTVLLKKSLKLKEQQVEYTRGDTVALELEKELDILLEESIAKDINSKTLALQKSLIKHRNSIFTFLYNKYTPPDNNASERAIRNTKVKQKISGQFKSGQHIFCILRSVIDTCKKRNIDVMNALSDIARLVPAE